MPEPIHAWDHGSKAMRCGRLRQAILEIPSWRIFSKGQTVSRADGVTCPRCLGEHARLSEATLDAEATLDVLLSSDRVAGILCLKEYARLWMREALSQAAVEVDAFSASFDKIRKKVEK